MGSRPTISYQPALDGVRAVAVLAVLALPCRGTRVFGRLSGRVGVLHPFGFPDHQPVGERGRDHRAGVGRRVLRPPRPTAAAGQRAVPRADRRARRGHRPVRRRRRSARARRRVVAAGRQLGVPVRRRLVSTAVPAGGRHRLAARALLVAGDRGAVLLAVADLVHRPDPHREDPPLADRRARRASRSGSRSRHPSSPRCGVATPRTGRRRRVRPRS